MTESRTRSRWRLGRALAVGAGGLFAGLVLLVLGAYGLAQSEAGRAWIARSIAAGLSTPGEIEVTIKRLEGRLPQQVRISGLSVRDRAGPWLRAAAVDIDWAPLDLLARRIRLSSVRIVDLSLERLPAGRAGDEAGAFPALPFDINVERLSVRDVRLGADVLGQPAAFRIEGEAGTRGLDSVTSTLVVERTDGVSGRAELTAVYRPREDGLRLDLAVREPAGGLIARALDLPDLPEVEVTLSGDGALDDWRGDLGLALRGLVSLRAEVALARQGATRFRLSGSATAGARGDAAAWRLIAGDSTFDLDGRWSDDRVLTLERAEVESPAIRLDLDGRLDTAELEVDARARARLKDPGAIAALAPDVGVAGLALEAAASGPLLRPEIDATAAAESLSAPGVDAKTIVARLLFSPARPLDRGPPQGALHASGTIEDLSVAGLEHMEPLIGRRVAWTLVGALDLDAARIEASDLRIEAGPTQAIATGTIGLADERIETAVRVTLDDLAGLGPLAGVAVRGGAELDAWVEARGFGRQATAALAGELSRVHVDQPIVAALFSGKSTVAANLAYDGQAGLKLSDIAIDSPAARVTGDAAFSVDFARLTAAYRARMDDTAVLAGPLGLDLGGPAEIRGSAEGAVANPRLQGRLGLTNATIEGLALDRLDLDFTADDLPTTPRGRFDVTAATPLGDVAGGAEFRLVGSELRLTRLSANSRGATARGALSVPVDGRPLAGALDVRAPDLGPWLDAAGIEGGGAATGQIRLSAEGPRQAARLVAEVTKARARLDRDRVARAETARVEITATDLTGTPRATAVVRAAGVSLGAVRLDELSLRAEGDRTALTWEMNGMGEARGPLRLDAAGRLRAEADEVAIEVARAEGRALGRDLRLRGPVSAIRRGEAVEVGPLDLSFGDARLRARARLDPARVSAEIGIDALPIASLAPLWPAAAMDGLVSGAVAIDGPRADPAGSGTVKITGLTVERLEDAPPLGLDLSADWRGGRLAVSGRLTGTPERDAELTADLPLRLDPDRLGIAVPSDEPISGRLAWRGDMAALWPLLPLDDHRLAGATDLTATLAGSAAAPRVSGTLRLSRGEYENLATGTLLKNLNADIDIDGSQAVLTALTARDGASGSISATGEAVLDPARGFPFKLAARMTDFAALHRDDVSATTDGEVGFEGSLERAILTGRFKTRLVEVRIIDRLPPEVVDLKVVETDGAGKAEVFAGEARPDGDIRLDVAIVMPNRVFVRGRGLDSEWSGDLTVTGSIGEPVVEGQLSLVRGQLSLLAKTFRLKSGTVRFPGGGELTPVLDVTAEHKAKDVTAIARVSGPATSPSITLGSRPELPQDEIISRILFGKDRNKLSALEGAQLAAAAAELTGHGGGLGALDFARSLLGVDVLSVETAAGGDAASPALSAGKYITEDVFVGVKKGVTEESGAVGVEVELTPNISVESETGATGESDIGIKFKWDY